jgi:hypothetical protein
LIKRIFPRARDNQDEDAFRCSHGRSVACYRRWSPRLCRRRDRLQNPAGANATQTGAPPASVPRPSLTPKAAEPASLPAAAGPAPNSDRRPARRYLRFGHYRIAYWKPFSIHWPHFHRHRIDWRRIS